ncbi:hypothetical protein EW093_07420 [Thiospirochaeta perfilievii]|uniref:histidine kinase n=1 Tax=Thiospirochaeta perfilievii TaxID=252967 RepID=A0A5C1QD27_9SPIO|nr:histidine kinase N-terminal 7TM domain-containing protein [Thiospirochaeta perfilievii]QEN04536.1 hypothetical protein EW093_07420 [Thiospirochaeta perfilievii]
MDYNIYKLLTPITVGFLFLSLSISIQYLNEKISKLIFLYQLSVLFYLIINYLEFISNDVLYIIFFAKLGHLFLELLAYFWFVFALNYTGYDHLIKIKIRVTLFLLIALNMIIIQTTDIHHLFYLEYNFSSKSGYTVLNADYGPLFWVVVSYSYVLLIAGVVFIVTSYIRGRSFLQVQALLILIGFLLPLVTNIIYVFRLIPTFNKDLSPVAFGITGLFIFISIYRFRLLHFTPLARNIVLHDLQNSIITLSPNFKIIDFNERASSLFHLSDKNLGDNIGKTEVGMFIGNIKNYVNDNNGSKIIKELEGLKYEISVKLLSKDDKTCKAIIINIFDVTDKIELIERLGDSNARLKEMQEQLVHKEKMAALGEISAGIAHEINNPLSFIKSNLKLLNKYLNNIQDGIADIDSRKYNFKEVLELVDESNEGVLRIGEVVYNLLNFSRDNQYEKTFQYNINNGIESTLVLARNQYKYKAIIKLELGDIKTFMTSGNEINQVLLNLLTNAAQAIPDGVNNGLITIKTFNEAGNVVCEISDNGEPISADDIEDIFSPFYTTKDKDVGTGIGLSISRGIIEKEFGGKLFVKESKIKTFRIEIPYKDNSL